MGKNQSRTAADGRNGRESDAETRRAPSSSKSLKTSNGGKRVRQLRDAVAATRILAHSTDEPARDDHCVPAAAAAGMNVDACITISNETNKPDSENGIIHVSSSTRPKEADVDANHATDTDRGSTIVSIDPNKMIECTTAPNVDVESSPLIINADEVTTLPEKNNNEREAVDATLFDASTPTRTSDRACSMVESDHCEKPQQLPCSTVPEDTSLPKELGSEGRMPSSDVPGICEVASVARNVKSFRRYAFHLGELILFFFS
jgi:hypothetical protein